MRRQIISLSKLFHLFHAACFAVLASLVFAAFGGARPLHATDHKSAKTEAPPEAKPGVPLAPETVDLGMYSRIREEGLKHSHVMEYASELFDGIGPRLTGSPSLAKAGAWAKAKLEAMGCANANLENWGDFGMGWQQRQTFVFMNLPVRATFIAQATPWSPATSGTQDADVIAIPRLQEEKDFEKWKGKLAGKIILYGNMPKINPDPEPQLQHYDEKKLEQIAEYPLNGDMTEQHVMMQKPKDWETLFTMVNFREKVAKFFADEHAVALLVPSYAGDGGIFRDDNGEQMGQYVYRPDHKQPIPSAVLSNENFGRVGRLLDRKEHVSISLNIDTEFTGDHEQGFNVIAEIPGSDSQLKDQVVMLGGHLDSWVAGTGATDDGAGTIVAIEAMRILTSIGIHPRRTIRVALWTGEEQGEIGSLAYVAKHFGTIGYSTTPAQLAVPEFLREQVGPVVLQPEHSKLSAYFNVDNGGGKLLGIYAQDNVAVAPIFTSWMEPLRDLGVTTLSMRESASSDQDSFDQIGLPAFQFIQDPRDYETRSLHSNQDVYERLSEPDLKQAAIVEAIFVYNAAMRDQMLPRKALPTFPAPRDGDAAPSPHP
jgi:carboxypeptidase Q